jgi:hypothetical protein
MQRCTHPHFLHCEIASIHAPQSDMTCVSPASLQRFIEIIVRLWAAWEHAFNPRQMRVGARCGCSITNASGRAGQSRGNQVRGETLRACGLLSVPLLPYFGIVEVNRKCQRKHTG